MGKQKGEYGYIRHQKRVRLIRTLLLYAVALAIFFAGVYLNHGDKRNIYTVIAMVGVIPASMNAVSSIMMWMRKSMDPGLFQEVQTAAGTMPVLYEVYLTTLNQNLYLDAVLITGEQVIAYTHEKKSAGDLRFFEEHVEKTLRAAGCRRAVKIFGEDAKKQFLGRLETISARGFEAGETNYLVKTTILAIAL